MKKILDPWNKVERELHMGWVYGHCWEFTQWWACGCITEFDLVIKLLLVVPRQWKDDWALRFVSLEIGNRNEANRWANIVVIIKIFSSIWTILYVVKFNLAHLSFMNVTYNFSALLKKNNCFDSFSKLIDVDVESVYLFWYFFISLIKT